VEADSGVRMQYSRFPKNSTLQLLQNSFKSASTTPQRPTWNTFGPVAVRDFWENGCSKINDCCQRHSAIAAMVWGSDEADELALKEKRRGRSCECHLKEGRVRRVRRRPVLILLGVNGLCMRMGVDKL